MIDDNQDSEKRLNNDSAFENENDKDGGNTRLVELLYIVIETPPNKTTYIAGETFDPTGMVVRAYYSNGTNSAVSFYQYSPTTPLTISTTYVTITFLNKSANQPVTVTSMVNCLSIDQNPYKTTYQVGDYFEPYGLIVRKYDSSGNAQIVYDYSFFPSTPLTINDNQITISHSGLTKTIFIVVNNPPVTGYFPTQYTKNSLIGNNPYYNLFDLSTLFNTNPISVSRDSYTLSFNIVYQSRMKGRLSTLCKGLPLRFKTNYHQFLIQDGLDDSSYPIYKFIDEECFIHSFYRIKNRLYYCRHSGLYLFFYEPNDDDYAKIVDSDKNELYFDENSRLIRIVNGKDSTNVKYITYNNSGFITKIHDGRHSSSEISFSYSSNLLSTVTFKYLGTTIKSLNLTYSTNSFGVLLTKITESASNQSRDLYSFIYNDSANHHSTYDRVQFIEDYLNNQVYRFSNTYFYTLNDFYVSEIKRGHFVNNTFTSKEYVHCLSSVIRNDAYKTIEEVTIDNQNEQCLTYFLTKSGSIASNFECGGLYDTTFKTLYKESGQFIDLDVGGSLTINSHGFKSFIGSLSFSTTMGLLLKYRQFVLRMYLKLNDTSSKRIRAILSYSQGLQTVSSELNINDDQYGKIILIEIPFSTNGAFLTVAFSLSFKNENDDNVDVDVADIYLDKKERTRLVFYDGNYSFDDLVTLKIYNSQYNPPLTYDNTSYPYFTPQDLLNTLFLLYRHDNLLCVGDLTLFASNGSSFLAYSIAFAGADQNDTNFILSYLLNSGANNWYFETKSPDNKIVTKTHYRFYSSYYEIKKETTYDNDSSTSQIEIKRYAYNNRLMQTTFTHDNVTSQTEYSYYSNGELKKVTSTCNNEEIVLYDTIQNGYGYITRKTSGRNSVNIVYQDYLEDTITRMGFDGNNIYYSLFDKTISYDLYKEETASIEYLNDDDSEGINGYFSDYTNHEFFYRLNNNHLYKLIDNYQNDSIVFARYNGSNYQNILTIHQDDDYDEVVYRIDSLSTLTIRNDYDQYKRIASQKVNNVVKATFTYENNIESPSTAKVKTVLDKYISDSGIVTSFDYDSYDSSVTNIDFNDGDFEIDIDKVKNENTYSFSFYSGTTFTLAYLSDKTVNTIETTSPHEVFTVRASFKNDAFNRLFKTSIEIGEYDWFVSHFNYQSGSNVIIGFVFGESNGDFNISTQYYQETYDYDDFGNLHSIAINNTSNARQYSYDGFARLVSESNNDVTDFNRTYSYYDDGRMEYFGSSHLIYNSNGQLEYFGNTYFTYDRYGNRLKKGNDQYIYERGKLLSSLTKNNVTTAFKYDYLGRRYQKTNGGVDTTYYYHDNKLITEMRSNGTTLLFLYRNNEIIGFYRIEYPGVCVPYYFIKNPFGLILGIIDEYGTILTNYVYDSWGNHIVCNPNGTINTDPSFIGNINPIRYHGYYYDTETSLYYITSRYYDPEIGLFISPDSVDYLDPTTISGLNLYAYCGNDPVNRWDPTGHFWDTVLDVLFIGWDIYNLFTNDGYKDWKNWTALGVDVAFAVIPFVTGGGGQVVKLANVADDISDFSKVTVIGETMTRVKDTATILDCVDNLYDGFKAYDRLSDLGKGGKVLAEIGGKASNVAWLYGKLRSGYKVVDIGIDTARAIRSSSYIAERITIGIWKSRNIWKWLYHLDF